MSQFASARLNAIEAYTPGEQPRDKHYIKLNTNESPFPPSPGVVAAITADEVRDLRLYCDPTCQALRGKLAEHYDVCANNVFVSNGSDDILNFAFMAYGQNGAVFADVTYGFYSVFAQLHGVQAEIVPLNEDFTLPIEKFCNKDKLVVIANPNAPTGMDIPLAEVEKIVKSNPDSVVLIDEAYVDFGGTSCADLTKKYPNLLCVGTFSKSRSLAGARLGFCIAGEALIQDLEKIKYSTNPYNVNRLTQLAGVWALEEDAYYVENAAKIMENREFTQRELQKLGFCVLPSKANFVFAKHEKISGEELYIKLKDKGVLIRHFGNDRIKEYNRITIGSRKEMEIFIQKVGECL